jgi:hypothetical protein
VALPDQADRQVQAVQVVLQVAPVLVDHLVPLVQVEKMVHQDSLQLLELQAHQGQMVHQEMQEIQDNLVLQVLQVAQVQPVLQAYLNLLDLLVQAVLQDLAGQQEALEPVIHQVQMEQVAQADLQVQQEHQV